MNLQIDEKNGRATLTGYGDEVIATFEFKTYEIINEVKTCTKCGKVFDECDEENQFGLQYVPGYGSGFDGENIKIDLCCDCFDEVVQYISRGCC